jgi:hemoglobin-like flavoprotein
MTPQHTQIVQDTWEQVAPIADTAAELFYSRLFELDPTLRQLFASTNMQAQGKLLMQMLAVAVKGLDNLDQLVPAVEQLGRRHVRYGVKDAHYETVGAALLWTLERGLGDAFTPAVREAWAETYAVLATVMKGATRGGTPDAPPLLQEARSVESPA